jgi:hypothetical protein
MKFPHKRIQIQNGLVFLFEEEKPPCLDEIFLRFGVISDGSAVLIISDAFAIPIEHIDSETDEVIIYLASGDKDGFDATIFSTISLDSKTFWRMQGYKDAIQQVPIQMD